MIGTLLHELVHNAISPHDQTFYKLLDTITQVLFNSPSKYANYYIRFARFVTYAPRLDRFVIDSLSMTLAIDSSRVTWNLGIAILLTLRHPMTPSFAMTWLLQYAT